MEGFRKHFLSSLDQALHWGPGHRYDYESQDAVHGIEGQSPHIQGTLCPRAMPRVFGPGGRRSKN